MVAYSPALVAYSPALVAYSLALVAYTLALVALQDQNGTTVGGLAVSGQKRKRLSPGSPGRDLDPEKRLQKQKGPTPADVGPSGQDCGMTKHEQKRRRLLRSGAVSSVPGRVRVEEARERLRRSRIASGPLDPAGMRSSRKQGGPSDAAQDGGVSEPQQMRKKTSAKRPRLGPSRDPAVLGLHAALQRPRPAAQAMPRRTLRSEAPSGALRPVTSRPVTSQPVASPFAASHQAKRADPLSSSRQLQPLPPPPDLEKLARAALVSYRSDRASLARGITMKGAEVRVANLSKVARPAKGKLKEAKTLLRKSSTSASARVAAPARGPSKGIASLRTAFTGVAELQRRLLSRGQGKEVAARVSKPAVRIRSVVVPKNGKAKAGSTYVQPVLRDTRSRS